MSDLDPPPTPWLDHAGHRRWLDGEGDRLLGFYQYRALDPDGGFAWLDGEGDRRADQPKFLWLNARMVHVFSLAHLAGRPGAEVMVRAGIEFLSQQMHDARAGGWYWSVGPGGPLDTTKQAYGHAFVLLAGASAAQAGLAARSELFDPAAAVIDERFWDEAAGLCVDTYDRDWTHLEPYRGQNANMHMAEAFLAASEATGDPRYAERAARMAERIIREFTGANGGRLPEHFDAEWHVELDYNRDNPENEFRPYGSTIGHWFEWARLLVGIQAGPAGAPWMLDAAVTLFDRGLREGWDPSRTGIRFTVDWDGRPLNEDRYHWVVAEAIGAAAALARATGEPRFERWYQRFWAYADRYLIDRDLGSWRHQLDVDNRLATSVWAGKPDLYHAYQATLAASMPAGAGFAAGLRVRAGRSAIRPASLQPGGGDVGQLHDGPEAGG